MMLPASSHCRKLSLPFSRSAGTRGSPREISSAPIAMAMMMLTAGTGEGDQQLLVGAAHALEVADAPDRIERDIARPDAEQLGRERVPQLVQHDAEEEPQDEADLGADRLARAVRHPGDPQEQEPEGRVDADRYPRHGADPQRPGMAVRVALVRAPGEGGRRPPGWPSSRPESEGDLSIFSPRLSECHGRRKRTAGAAGNLPGTGQLHRDVRGPARRGARGEPGASGARYLSSIPSVLRMKA